MKPKHGYITGLAVLIITALFTITACGNKGDPTSPPNSPDPPPSRKVISGTLSNGGINPSLARTAGPGTGQTFYAEIADNNTIDGKLEDDDLIYRLKGLYDPDTRGFSVQAKSSTIIFSLAGELTTSGTIDASKSQAKIMVKDASNEWTTIVVSIVPSTQTAISDTVTAVGGDSIPEDFRGRWTDLLTDLKFIVTENSITMKDGDDIQDLTVVEVTGTGNTRQLVFGGLYGEAKYIGKVYVHKGTEPDTTLTTAIGSATMNDITWGSANDTTPLSTAISTLPGGTTIFVAPYCSNDSSKVSTTGIYPANGWSPLFTGTSATTNAKNVPDTNIKAISGFVMVLR
jgi:hypothetical protein